MISRSPSLVRRKLCPRAFILSPPSPPPRRLRPSRGDGAAQDRAFLAQVFHETARLTILVEHELFGRAGDEGLAEAVPDDARPYEGTTACPRREDLRCVDWSRGFG